MQILGEIAELGKISERPYHRHGRVMTQAPERRFEFVTHLKVAIPTKTNGGLPDMLDAVECFFTFLLSQSFAQQAAEQANVFSQGQILFDYRIRLIARVHGDS